MLFLSSVCITFIMMYGNMLNDYLDIKSDMISHPSRPLPQKKINLKYLRLSIVFCLTCSILLSFYFNYNTFIFLLLLIIPLLTTYNFYFKGLPLIGNMIIAFLLSSVFFVYRNCINKYNKYYNHSFHVCIWFISYQGSC